ncbi:MAG: condensation domain-containing protein, partial [Pseudonocardiaceae bacterium]
MVADPPAPTGPDRYTAPRTSTERTLARIWAELLRVERVGIEDNFFDLGGDSILTIRVTSRVRATLGAEISPRALYDHPTIAALAWLIPDGPAARDAITAVPRSRELPLSFGQQRLWFLHNFAPHSAEYNSALPLRLLGKLDIDALVAALTAIVDRHEILRTTFASGADGGVQIVHPPVPVVLPLVDLSELTEAERTAELDNRLLAQTTRPFDLRRGPVLRALLLRLAQQDHVLHLGMHHIVSDGWSMGVFIRELTACYTAALRGSTPHLPALPVQYADFASWQRRRFVGRTADESLAYWRRRLDGVPVLALPTDRPRPVVKTSTGAHEQFMVPAELTARLREFGDRQDTTLFTILVAATQVVLARYSGRDDIAVGTVVAGHNRAELEHLIGFFVNTVVLRSEVDENLSFADFVARVRETVLEAFVHAEAPFEQVVETLRPERDTSSTPLVQVMVVLHNTPEVAVELPGLRVAEVELDNPTAQFDLTFEFQERSGVLVADLCYNTDLFDTSTITRLAGHLLALLDVVVSDAGTPLRRLPLVSEAEHRQLVLDWNGTGSDRPGESTVIELFERMVAHHPDLPAVRAGGQTVSYRELDDRAWDLATRLVALGVRRGDRLCIIVTPGVQAVTNFVAAAKIGAVYISMDPDVGSRRLRTVVDDSAAVRVLTDETVLPGAPSASWHGPSPHDPLCCVYTSGSTGRPKGIVLTHRNVVNLVSWHEHVFGGAEGDRCGQVANLGFDASVWEVWSALCRGRCLCVAEPATRRDPRALGRWVAEEGLRWCFIPTVVGERLIADEALMGAGRLRHLVVGGEQLTRLPAGDMPFRLVNAYGPTEVTVCATWFDTTGWRNTERGEFASPPIGRPVCNVQAHVLDRYLRPVPVGVMGELYLGGDGVAHG